jgi:HEPN domain-containing protein
VNIENIDKLIQYWVEGSEEDFDTMRILFSNKKYVYTLFFLHLSLEKLLKALFVKTYKAQAPITHNLIN